MITPKTLTHLQGQALSPERARELGHMGCMQWLGGLDGAASHEVEAARAYQMAPPFLCTGPGVAVFCDLGLADGPVAAA